MTLHYRFQLGNAEIVVLSDGTSAFPSEFLMIGAEETERLDACNKWGYDPDSVPSSINVIYIKLNGSSILFDSGAGSTLPGCGSLPDALVQAGIDVESIDRVIHTHAHLDHLGWNTTDDGDPMFPNARYCIGRTEFEFWSSPETLTALERSEIWNLPAFEPAMAHVARTKLLGLGERIETFDDDGEPVPKVQAIPAFGHTPGHLAFEIDLGSDCLLITGDLALNPVHVDHADWFPGVDLDPQQAMRSRASIFNEAADSGALVAGYHLPFPGIGRLTRQDGGWEWHPVDADQRLQRDAGTNAG